MLVLIAQLKQLAVHPRDDRQSLAGGFDALERRLADGRAFLGGAGPDLSDVSAWPLLWALEKADARPPGPHSQRYWERVRERRSLVATRPH
jgi:glutathione S-transferase